MGGLLRTLEARCATSARAIFLVVVSVLALIGATPAAQSQPLPSETKLLSSPNPSTFGQNVDLSASIFTYSPAPTGTVGFADGATPLGTVPVQLAYGVGYPFSAGFGSSCFVLQGGIACWGANFTGQLGNGSTTDSSTFVPVTNFFSGRAVAMGTGGHACGIDLARKVYCWGYNSQGQLGNTTFTNTTARVPVSDLIDSTGIAVGTSFSCALTVADGVRCWGANDFGQLGDGTTIGPHTSPVDVVGLTSGVARITAGDAHSCALTNAGGVKCWGANNNGELGDGTTTLRTTAVDVVGLTSGVASITTFGHTNCAVLTDGTVKCWGSNGVGILGDGTLVSYSATPVTVLGLTTHPIVAVAVGGDHACALEDGGGVKCWGQNNAGQLGDGTTINRPTPLNYVVGGTSGYIGIWAGGGHTCGIRPSLGGLTCWGANGFGQLGNGTTTDSHFPVNSAGLAPYLAFAKASLSTTALTVGTHSINAAYSGDVFHFGSVSPAVSQVVTATDSLALGSSANPSALGDPVTFTATLTLGGAILPTGTVTFYDGVTVLGTQPISVLGVAQFTTSALTGGSHTITASYSGDATFPPATSPPLTQVVQAHATTTALGVDINPSGYGQTITFTATVSSSGSPTGTVTFKDGPTTLATVPLSGNTATLATAALLPGNHAIAATYNGDGFFNPSTSNAIAQVVNKGATTATLSGLPPASVPGQSVTFTASVQPVAPAPGPATGLVTVMDGAAVVGAAPLSGGSASFSTASLTAGSHALTAVYGGDPNFTGTTSPAVAYQVNKAGTATALAASASATTFGQAVTFTATVTVAAPANVAPTGNVTFLDTSTGASLGTVAVSGGTAALTTSSLNAGSHAVTATYNGDVNLLPSTSASRTVAVSASGAAIALISAPNPSTVGQAVTLTATMSSAAGTPTGTVTFKDGGNTIGSGALSGGVATMTTTLLPAGSRSLTAEYPGNGSFPAATSTAQLHTVILSCSDSFATATVISGGSGTATGAYAGNPQWCRWTAPGSGPVTFDTTGSKIDTVLTAYTGGAGSLTQVATNDNISSTNRQSRMTFTAAQGVTYSISLSANANDTYMLNWSQPVSAPTLMAAVLPSSRSVVTGSAATAFATVINSGSKTATGCTVSLPQGFPAGFFFQPTTAANVPTGVQNGPVDIAIGSQQGFVFGVTPTVDLNSAEIGLVFACTNASPAASVVGLNTLSLTSAGSPTPDLVSIVSTPSNDGIVTVPSRGTAVFSAATVNIGAPGELFATVDDNGKNFPLGITLCRTNPSTGACTNPATPGTSVKATLATNEIATYAVFLTTTGTVAFDPANNRLFLRLKTGDGVVRGATSVAVKTKACPPFPTNCLP